MACRIELMRRCQEHGWHRNTLTGLIHDKAGELTITFRDWKDCAKYLGLS